MTRAWLRGTVAALAGALLGLAAAPVAQAEEWNEYRSTLPAYVAGPTPFEVVVDGSVPVCSMTFGETTRTAAPWTFTYDPRRSPEAVTIATCDGGSDWIGVDAALAFEVDGTIAYRAKQGGRLSVTVANRMDAPGSVTVTGDSGAVLLQRDIPPRQSVDLPIPVRDIKATTSWRLTMTGSNGLTQTRRVILAKGWVPLMDVQNAGAFPACSTIPWFYDPAGAPQDTVTLRKDLTAALARLSREAGLRFAEAPTREEAVLVYSWKDLGRRGPSGVGGFEWSSDGPSTASVEFNTRDSWPTDRFAGLGGWKGSGYGPAGRGWLIIHETMHALGFGHVQDRKSIMHPVNTGQHGFTRGDREGLLALYPRSCTT